MAGAMALSGIGDPRTLSKLAEHPSRAVRLAAVVAMRMRGDALGRFLNSTLVRQRRAAELPDFEVCRHRSAP